MHKESKKIIEIYPQSDHIKNEKMGLFNTPEYVKDEKNLDVDQEDDFDFYGISMD